MFRITLRTSRASSRTTPRSQTRRALGLLSLALLSGCAGSPSAPEASLSATPARVRFMDYRQGTAFELVNEAHTDRVEFYSKVRSDTMTKVANDEVMGALLEYIQTSGFHRHARSGVAPRQSSSYRWGGEVETKSGTVFMLVNDQTPKGKRQAFLDCYMNHVNLWSNVFQLQRVDTDPGEVFKKPETRR